MGRFTSGWNIGHAYFSGHSPSYWALAGGGGQPASLRTEDRGTVSAPTLPSGISSFHRKYGALGTQWEVGVPGPQYPQTSSSSHVKEGRGGGREASKYRSGNWGNKLQSQLRPMFVSSSRRKRMRRTKGITDQNRLAEEPKRRGLDGTMETSLMMLLRCGKHDNWIKRQPWGVGQQFKIPKIPQGRNVGEKCSHLRLPIG